MTRLGIRPATALIRDFGARLSSLTRECDTISRLGGDEFAILIEDAHLPDIHRLAQRIVDDVRRPFQIFGSQVYVGVSIGIALSPDSGADRLELMRTADISLYRAKDGGRNGYCLFTPDMDESVKLRGAIEKELRNAVASGEGLRVHYQPQVGADGAIIGLEALLRWDHPTRGLIAPDQFVSVAEESGLIVPLGEWVLGQACLVVAPLAQAVRRREPVANPVPVAGFVRTRSSASWAERVPIHARSSSRSPSACCSTTTIMWVRSWPSFARQVSRSCSTISAQDIRR